VKTRVVLVDPVNPERDAILDAVELLRTGGLVAFPTETVYGLAALALNEAAVRRVFTAKERPLNEPLAIQVAQVADLDTIVKELPESARRLAQRFLPGPLTLVLDAAETLPGLTTKTPKHQGTHLELSPLYAVCCMLPASKVGVRIPAHPVARAILNAIGAPLVVTSANRHGQPAPITAQQALEQLDGRVELILDGGRSELGIESTVIDLTTQPPMILRSGAITQAEIEAVIGKCIRS
jgi:L-threonylcarbamoyladenylate synthase